MSDIKLKHIYKVYGSGVKAVNDFNLEINDKEFIVFVGPSGCGKSTTLRMIAGLEDISAGELWINDQLCNDVEPKNRNIAMVFQNYALFPNMTVYDNIAFGLRMHKIDKDEIKKRVLESAEILGITEYLDRKPKALSGGQRQRVALGRSIVRNPNVFLLDEPLSNLDAKLRTKMRTEIIRLHKRLGSTFIYVTHDQVEAMTMGDRIVVMKDGVIQQIDTPTNIFNYPANKFVANFIGSPQMNFFDAVLKPNQNGDITIASNIGEHLLNKELTYRIDNSFVDGQKKVIFGIRPNDIYFDIPQSGNYSKVDAYVSLVEDLGVQKNIHVNVCESELLLENSKTAFAVSTNIKKYFDVGEKVTLYFDLDRIQLFDSVSELSIKKRIPEEVTISCTVSNGKMSLLGSNLSLSNELSNKLNDGNYDVTVSTSDIVVSDNGFKGIVERVTEYQKGCYYLRVALGNEHIYITSTEKYVKNDSITISFDQEKMSFNQNGKCVLKKLASNFFVDCNFEKKKVDKDIIHYLKAGELELQLDDNYIQRLYDFGRKIFKTNLKLELCDNALSIDDSSDFILNVNRVLDYGRNKFVEFSIGNCLCYIKTTDTNIKKIGIKIDYKKTHIFDASIDMMLF